MRFLDTKPVLLLVFLMSAGSSLMTIWVVIGKLADGEGFLWEAIPFLGLWIWAACSTGGRLARDEPPPEDGGPP